MSPSPTSIRKEKPSLKAPLRFLPLQNLSALQWDRLLPRISLYTGLCKGGVVRGDGRESAEGDVSRFQENCQHFIRSIYFGFPSICFGQKSESRVKYFMHKAVGFVRLLENILFIFLLNPEGRSLKDGPRRPPTLQPLQRLARVTKDVVSRLITLATKE